MSSSSTAAASASSGGDATAPGEEGILVAIRMRPLNTKESTSNNRVWKVLRKYNSITQQTPEGKPLPERVTNRNFFSFDKTFGEKSSTKEVYDATSKGIVNSIVNGLNGTIFAYGQTSSGKTFTMQGSGTIQEGAGGGGGSSNDCTTGGIVHMAASDIFNHIEQDPDRVFLVRVSFIEIYNEEVRDLLVSGDSSKGGSDHHAHLTIREDKQRGVFVNSNESIVTSMNSLLSVLFAGEKNRSVAATGMNERSSRSHTIFRITVESRLKETNKGGDDEEGSDDEEDALMRGEDVSENKTNAVRVSTLNLVDLAGSESVRHTGNTGDRQKEGGKINQSLLTLSRVIGSLGQNAQHVNFRDSKLTRILQPSLSGNARMAVICCATPSELYLEETRSTLQFASRAKLVKTRAQVNEVMDDRSLIKKLQRELKEARQGGPGPETMEQMKALEEKAASAEVANRKAEEDLKRMKELILKGGVLPGNLTASSAEALFVYNDNDETIKTTGTDKIPLSSKASNRKRRYSDGVINENSTDNTAPRQDVANGGSFSSPARGGNAPQRAAKTEMKKKKAKKPSVQILPPEMKDDFDIGLLREALAAKSAQAASYKAKLVSATEKLQHEHGEKEMLRLAKHDLESQVSTLASDKEFCLVEQDVLMAEKDNVISTSLEKIEKMLEERRQQALSMSELQATVESLQGQLAEKDKEITAKCAELEGKLETAADSNTQLTDKVASLESANEDVVKALSEKDAELEEVKSTIATMTEESSKELSELRTAKEASDERVATLEISLESEKAAADSKLAEVEGKLEEAMESNTQIFNDMASLQTVHDDVIKQLAEKEDALSQTSKEVAELQFAKTQVEEHLSTLELANQELERQLEVAEEDIVRLSKENNNETERVQELQTYLSNVTKENEEKTTALQDITQTLQSETDAKNNLSTQLSELQTKYDSIQSSSNKAEDDLRTDISNLEATVQQKYHEIITLNEAITSTNSQIASLESNVSTLTSERDALVIKVESTKLELSSVQEDVSVQMSKIEELESKLVEVGTELNTAEERVNDLTSEGESNNTIVSTLQQEKEKCMTELEAVTSEKEKMLVDMETMKTTHAETLEQKSQEVDSMKLQVSDATSQEELESKIESTTNELTSMKEEAAKLTTEISQLESSVVSITADRDAANERVTELMSGNKNVEDVLSSLKSEKDELVACLEKTKEVVSRVETERDEAIVKLNGLKDSVDNLQVQAESLSTENDDLKSQINSSTAKVESIESERKLLTDELKRVTDERDDLKTNVENITSELSTLQSSVADLTTERDNAEVKLQEMSSGKTKSSEEQSVLQKEKEALESKVQELDSEKEQAESKIGELNATISELHAKNETLVNDLDAAKQEVNDFMAQVEKSDANYKALLSEKDERVNQVQLAADEKARASADEIRELNDQLLLLNQQVAAANTGGGSSPVVDSLEKEIIELKSLLSSANASVDEARSAALLADQELEEKELQLENALRNLAEHEDARRIAEDKLRLAELSPRNSPARTDSEEELLRDMEVLMGEKIDAESRLEQELNRRKVVEDDIKRAAEEEKQQLMDEAEEKMVSLRDEISQLKSDLSRVESDCYNMKDVNTDLQDKITRFDAKATESDSIVTSISDELNRERNEKNDLQEQLNALEEQSSAFKAQVFAAKASFEADAQARLDGVEEQLNEALSQLAKSRNEAKMSMETIADLNSDIVQYRKELESVKSVGSNEKEIELSQLREALAQTKLDLSHSEADCLSAKRDLETAKEKIASVKQHEHEKQQKFATKAKDAIETLKERLAKAESNNAAGTSVVQVENLQSEVEELKSTLSNKEERIKKLEKSKITKSQIANIQKLKDERSQYMAEAKEYKQRVEELESNKLPSRRGGLRERKDTEDQSREIANLQDDLRQCEDKLRKYVKHSERLENDRKGVIEAISSCDVGDIVGDGVVEMVASLCDKLVSIEEECDALASSEGKAAEYLMELDALRKKYTLLEQEVQGYEENDTKLIAVLAESKANLKRAQEKISLLMKDNESLKAMAESAKGNVSELQSERRRQMQYLENENLQLGDELKRTKKELSSTKSELDVIRKGTFNNEQTEELQGLGHLLGSASTKRAPKESASKGIPPSGNKRIPLSSSRKRCPDSPAIEGEKTEKENDLNKKQRTLSSTIQSPFGSAKKKTRSANPFSSVKKAARRTRKALDDTPTKQYALGDSEPTADVTGECNQS